jgi:hypothetical protein
MSKKDTVVLTVKQEPFLQEDHNSVTCIYFFMEFRFDDLNWDKFGARVLRLSFKSVNYKKKLSVHISFVLRHSIFLLSKTASNGDRTFCPGMERKQCDVCISSLFLLWYKFISFSEKHAVSRFTHHLVF